jgi:hypothetical protein
MNKLTTKFHILEHLQLSKSNGHQIAIYFRVEKDHNFARKIVEVAYP